MSGVGLFGVSVIAALALLATFVLLFAFVVNLPDHRERAAREQRRRRSR